MIPGKYGRVFHVTLKLAQTALVFLLFLPGCSRGVFASKNRYENGPRVEYMLGTICRIDLFENSSAALYDRLFTRLAELEVVFSANRPDSELAALNRNAGKEPLPVSPELFTVMERARYFAEISGGAFDPTVGPLVGLWNISGAGRIPSRGEIKAALELINWQDLELNPASLTSAARSGGRAFLKRQGMALDLGGIAKGYAAGELARIVQKENIPRAIIDLGGDIYVWGTKNDGTPWRIGIQDPIEERGNYAGILELGSGISAVTSGVYERYFTGDDGRRYHHILDTGETANETSLQRGYPVENGILSVTITAPSPMDADALSTACFALGYERGRVLAEDCGAGAVFIFADKTIRGTPEALAAFTLTNETYMVKP